MSCNEDNDDDISQATTNSGKKKKEHSVKFKLQVVEWKSSTGTATESPADALVHCLKEGKGMPDGVASLVQDLSELMQGLEVEAPEDPEDDAGIDSDVSVISADDQAAEDSEEFEEDEYSDSEFRE